MEQKNKRRTEIQRSVRHSKRGSQGGRKTFLHPRHRPPTFSYNEVKRIFDTVEKAYDKHLQGKIISNFIGFEIAFTKIKEEVLHGAKRSSKGTKEK